MVEVGGWKINEVEKTSPCHLRKQNAKKNWTDNRNENAALRFSLYARIMKRRL